MQLVIESIWNGSHQSICDALSDFALLTEFCFSRDAAWTEGRGCQGSLEPILISLQIHDWKHRGLVLCPGANLHVD